MSQKDSMSETVKGTEYSIQYDMLKESSEVNEALEEYGISCVLFKNGMELERRKSCGISPDYKKVYYMMEKIAANQVFPVHLRDVIEDLLIKEYSMENRIAL